MQRRCRLTQKVGQTPQEFGARAQEFLTAQKLEAVSKDLPLRIIELFYKARYGGMVIPASQLQEIDRQLDFLNVALKNGPRLANCYSAPPSLDHDHYESRHEANSHPSVPSHHDIPRHPLVVGRRRAPPGPEGPLCGVHRSNQSQNSRRRAKEFSLARRV